MEKNLGLQMVKEMYPLMQVYYIYFGDLFIRWLFYHCITCLTKKKTSKKVNEWKQHSRVSKDTQGNKKMYYKQKWQSKKIKDSQDPSQSL